MRDPIRKTVSSVIGAFDLTSATPWPKNHASDPSRTTPTAKPAEGQRPRTPATLAVRSASSIPGGAWPAALIFGPVAEMLIAGSFRVTSPACVHGGYLGSIGVMMPSLSSSAAAASRHRSSRYRGPITCTD